MLIRQPRLARCVADNSPRRELGTLGVHSATDGGSNHEADVRLARSAFTRPPTLARTTLPTKFRCSWQRTSGRPFSNVLGPVKSAADYVPAMCQFGPQSAKVAG
ncbi:hypothetical protein MRX96_003612 [Rhipicephalus microplus]